MISFSNTTRSAAAWIYTAALAFLATSAAAQDGPSFDCAKAESSVEELLCDDPALAALDRRLATTYAAAQAAASGLDAGAEDAAADLRAMQRGWIKGRDECWKAADLPDCVRASYEMRAGQLTALWMLEDPVETVFWQCGNSLADELVTMRFTAEIPTLRLERGDTVTYAVQSPDSSVFYGDFGVTLTLEDGSAVLEMPQGTETRCTPR